MTATLTQEMNMAQVNEFINALTALNNKEINDKAAKLKYILMKKYVSELIATSDLIEASNLLAQIQDLKDKAMEDYVELVKKYQAPESEEAKGLAQYEEKMKQLEEKNQQRAELKRTANKLFSTVSFFTSVLVLAISLVALVVSMIFIPVFPIAILTGMASFAVGYIFADSIGFFFGKLAQQSKVSKYVALSQEVEQLENELICLEDLKKTIGSYVNDKDHAVRFEILEQTMSDVQDDLIEELQKRNVEDAEWIDESVLVKVENHKDLVANSRNSFFTYVEDKAPVETDTNTLAPTN